MNLRPVCEFVDADGGTLAIAIHLRGADEKAGTVFQLRLNRRWGAPAVTVQAPVVDRVNTVGRRTRAALRFSVPIDQIPDGAVRLEIARKDSDAWVPVATTPGLLACSRPESLGERRMQVLPAAGRPATWIRVSTEHRLARFGWALRNIVREMAFVMYGRRFTWVRPLRLLTAPLVPRRPIWLVAERRETARDNGFALFSYLRRTRPNDPIYYVIAKDSPMADEVARLGHVVWHSSLRHRLLMLHAAVLANAYSIKHMLPSRWHPGAYMNQCAWRVGAYRVYLKHGVHLSPDAVKRANGGYDVVLTVGPQETEALARTSGYTARQLRETGLSRYDRLVPERPSRTILFMPTWRRYLVPKLFGSDDALVAYEGSTYQQCVHGLLASTQLADALDRHRLNLQVVPHYNLTGLLQSKHLGSERITILEGTTADIPHLIRSCALLLTDYSSVQFDVAYLGAPVVYWQFDRDEYAAGHGGTSWFDTQRDGFGPITSTIAETVRRIDAYAQSGFERESLYTERVDRVFAHKDTDNCRRITQVLEELVPAAYGQ